MALIDTDRIRFEELLPFYINQTLSADDAIFMQKYLAEHSLMQNEVGFAKALHAVVKQTGASRADDAGLDQLLSAYRLLNKRPSWVERIRLSYPNWGFTPAFAVAASVIAVQSMMLAYYLPLWPETQYRGISNQAQIKADLKITVNPQSNFNELAILLRQTGCRVVSGPSEIGELWVALDEPEKVEQIKRTLLDSALVDDVVNTQTKQAQ